jgi:hypothetical protein
MDFSRQGIGVTQSTEHPAANLLLVHRTYRLQHTSLTGSNDYAHAACCPSRLGPSLKKVRFTSLGLL